MVEELASKRKASYQRYLKDPTDPTNRALDLMGNTNVVLCKDDTIKYLDTSSKRGLYSEISFHTPIILGTTAILEIVAGREPKSIVADPFYTNLVHHEKIAPVAKLVNTPEQFLTRLRRIVGYDLYDEDEQQRSNLPPAEQQVAI